MRSGACRFRPRSFVVSVRAEGPSDEREDSMPIFFELIRAVVVLVSVGFALGQLAAIG